jgi:hypothetical protein
MSITENKDISSYKTTENQSINNEINPLKRNVFLPNIKSNKLKIKARKLFREIDKRKENNSIYATEESNSERGSKIMKSKKRKQSLIKSYNDKGVKALDSFNVFGNEDKFIKELMEKFNSKSHSKTKKIDKKRDILNKLYGIDPKFTKRMNIAKRNKKMDLEDYQANTFKILTTNDIGKSELFDLAYNLKNLRLQSDSVSPLPPINLNIIYDHVYKNNHNNVNKKKTIKELINDSHEPRDEFEKEEKLIKQMMSYKATQRGKRNKAFDILPEYLKTALSKRNKNNI